jgi:hypothetical protein
MLAHALPDLAAQPIGPNQNIEGKFGSGRVCVAAVQLSLFLCDRQQEQHASLCCLRAQALPLHQPEY